ncbi:hypothetical protein [Pseudomonas sp. LB3P58]
MNYSSQYPATKMLDMILEVLSEENLHAYDTIDLAKSLVGLKVALKQELPVNYSSDVPVSLSLLKKILKICVAARGRLNELGATQAGAERTTLSAVVAHIDTVFSLSYRISQSDIDDARFEDKLRELLIALNLRRSEVRSFGGAWDNRTNEEIKLEEAEKLQGLLDFARTNTVEVITTVYRWAENGYGHKARIDQQFKSVIEVFDLLQDARQEVPGLGRK